VRPLKIFYLDYRVTKLNSSVNTLFYIILYAETKIDLKRPDFVWWCWWHFIGEIGLCESQYCTSYLPWAI